MPVWRATPNSLWSAIGKTALSRACSVRGEKINKLYRLAQKERNTYDH